METNEATNNNRITILKKIHDLSKEWGTTVQLVANIIIIIMAITIFFAIRQLDIQTRSFKININNIAIEAIDKMHRWYSKNPTPEKCEELKFLEQIAAYYNYISVISSEYQSHKKAISIPQINLRNGIYDVLERRVLPTLKCNIDCGYYPNELMKYMKYSDFSDLNESNRTRIETKLTNAYDTLKQTHKELYKYKKPPSGAPPDFPFSP